MATHELDELKISKNGETYVLNVGDRIDDLDARKANKAENPVHGYFAGLDAEGNLINSMHSSADYLNAPFGVGSLGRVPRSNGDGTTTWEDIPTSQEITDAVDNWMDAHVEPGTAIAIDDTLSSTTEAAQAAAAGNQILISDTQPTAPTNKVWFKKTPQAEVDVPTMDDDFNPLHSKVMLQAEIIPDTTQAVYFDLAGKLTSIVHSDNEENVIRSDAFTFDENAITEVRTLYTGETLTIVTHTDTLVTTATYAAAE